MTNSILPPGFEILDPFAADWALETQDQRYVKRRNTSAEALRAFYDAMLPHIEKILDEVDRYPLGTLPESHRPLYAMALSLAEIAPHVELYRGDPLVPHAFAENRMLSLHGDQPTWAGKRPSP
jgi:hypothetical protein